MQTTETHLLLSMMMQKYFIVSVSRAELLTMCVGDLIIFVCISIKGTRKKMNFDLKRDFVRCRCRVVSSSWSIECDECSALLSGWFYSHGRQFNSRNKLNIYAEQSANEMGIKIINYTIKLIKYRSFNKIPFTAKNHRIPRYSTDFGANAVSLFSHIPRHPTRKWPFFCNFSHPGQHMQHATNSYEWV